MEDVLTIITSPEVSFRPLGQSDLPMLCAWLAEPHVRRFYQKTPVSLEDVTEEYGPMIRGEDPTLAHLAVLEDAPYAYIQAYRNADNPVWAEITGAEDGISLDLFIGDPAYLHRGLGRAALDVYLRRVALPHYAGETRAYMAHEPDNVSALACSAAVGFQPERSFLEYGVEMTLMAIDGA